MSSPPAWNRTQKSGGDVVLAKLNPDGTVRSVEPFLTGFVEDNRYLGRPVDVSAGSARRARTVARRRCARTRPASAAAMIRR